jgi:hypothetical protein
MFRKLAKSLLAAGLLAGASTAMASEPMVLSDETLDSVSAGFTFNMPTVPTSAAFAYAYTSATSSPWFQALINVGYSADAGVGQGLDTWFDISVNWNAVDLSAL